MLAGLSYAQLLHHGASIPGVIPVPSFYNQQFLTPTSQHVLGMFHPFGLGLRACEGMEYHLQPTQLTAAWSSGIAFLTYNNSPSMIAQAAQVSYARSVFQGYW